MSAPGSRQTSQAPENLPPGWSYQLDSRTRQYIFFDPNGDSAQIAPTPWIPLVLSTATSATESPSNGATAAARLRRDHGDRIDAARRLRGLAASPPDQGWQPHAAPRPSSDNYDSSQVSPLRARINDLRQRERKPALTWNGITAEPGEPEPHESVQPAKRRKIKIEDGTDNANTDANVANSPLAEPASELFAPPYPGNASNSDVLSPGPVDDNAFLTTEDAATKCWVFLYTHIPSSKWKWSAAYTAIFQYSLDYDENDISRQDVEDINLNAYERQRLLREFVLRAGSWEHNLLSTVETQTGRQWTLDEIIERYEQLKGVKRPGT